MEENMKEQSINLFSDSFSEALTNIRIFRYFFLIHELSKYGIIDSISIPGMTVERLCKDHSLVTEKSLRVIAFLESLGVIYRDKKQISLTKFGSLFSANSEESLIGVLDFVFSNEVMSAYKNLVPSLRDDRNAFNIANGSEAFELDPSGSFHQVFQKAMDATSVELNKLVAASLGAIVPEGNRLLDLGGGSGSLLVEVSKSRSDLKLINFDINKHPRSGLFENVIGDFFKNEIPKSDITILKKIIHDWGDEQVVKILRKVRQESKPKKVIVIDTLVSSEDQRISKVSKALMDMEMLIMHGGGRERKFKDFQNLAYESGYSLERSFSLNSLYHFIILEPFERKQT